MRLSENEISFYATSNSNIVFKTKPKFAVNVFNHLKDFLFNLTFE